MDSNDGLVDHLVDENYINSRRVESAFRNVDRKSFVPRVYGQQAYKDKPLEIGENSTISAPHMVAINTELLRVDPNNKVLEIGSGSGYQAAILSELAENVLGVEINRRLVKSSRQNLRDRDNIEIIHGDSLKPVNSVFDRILYSVATDSFEPSKDYLSDHGIIVAPIIVEGSQFLRKFEEGSVTNHGRVSFVEMF